MTTKTILVATNDHPYIQKAKDKMMEVLPYEDFLNDLEQDKVSKNCRYIDAAILPTVEKEYFFHLTIEKEIHFIPDLSTLWGENGKDNSKREFRYCRGIKQSRFEAYGEDLSWSSELDLEPVLITNPKVGFHVPRTLAMIINEAYFAIEDGLCSKEDLDWP